MITNLLLLLLFAPSVLSNCFSLYQQGERRSGFHDVKLEDGSTTRLLCEMEAAGGGWTVIQHRNNGDEPYWNRTWQEYKEGFGDATTNGWVGLDLINRLTSTPQTLRIELSGDRNPGSPYVNDFYFQEYAKFAVGPESNNYTLSLVITDSWPDFPPGNATTGWYDITTLDGVQFSTVDRINDPTPACVTDYHLGGWWLHNCAFGSLNGEYVPPIEYGNGYGLMFIINGLYVINPVTTKMMIRPASS